MNQLTQTPLAWKNLTHDWRRLALALAGVAVAVLLMLMQIGFMFALFDSPLKIVDSIEGDLFLVSKARYTVTIEQRFPRHRLNQAAACPGVKAAVPIYAERTFAILRSLAGDRPNKGYPIRVIGLDPNQSLFSDPEIAELMELVSSPRTALIDRKSKDTIFPFAYDDDEALRQQPAELADQRIQIVGTFEMGTDFVHDGNLLMTAENFARYFPTRPPSGDPLASIDLGVLLLDDDADINTVKADLRERLDDDVFVMTRKEYRAAEMQFWSRSTPIGQIFIVGVVVGFIVGVIICYQIIASDIADHMPEFATLKAMGYSESYFYGLIVAQAVYLSLLGFVVGIGIGNVLYQFISNSTGLPMMITWGRGSLILVLTLVMCVTSGLLALRKLLKADPASLFA
jgi:putative ABC transport system permease protein